MNEVLYTMCVRKWKWNFEWKSYFENLGVCRRILLKLRSQEFVSWIHLAQDRFHWWALVITILAFKCHSKQRISSLAEKLLASKEVPCCIELSYK